MAASTSCVSTSQTATSRRVYLLRTINVRLHTPSFLFGRTSALIRRRDAPASRAERAVSLPPYLALRPIASLTLSGAQCISLLPLRRRISRRVCMRIIPTSGLMSFSAQCSQGAINRMFLVYRVRTMPLRRTSAVPTRQQRAPAPIPARVVEHQHLQQQPQQQQHLQLQLQQQLQLQPQLQRRTRRQQHLLRQQQRRTRRQQHLLLQQQPL